MANELPPLKFNDLAAALLPMADDLVPAWLPGGVRRGHEWVCGSLAGGKGTSCSVNLNTGQWGDFSSEEKGHDLLSLYKTIHNVTMTKACVELARSLGLESVAGVVTQADGSAVPARPPRPAPPPKKPPEREGWRAVVPVPGYAPAVNYKHHHRQESDIVHVSEYWRDGALYGYVVRFATSDGGKDDIARTFCESEAKGGARWHWKQWEVPRPLYLPGRTSPNGRTVLLVEGERKGDVLQGVLDAGAPGVYCVVGWPGGCKAWDKASWDWLSGHVVIGWPDCDSKREQPTAKERKAVEGDAEALAALKASKPYLPYNDQPGMKAMRGIGALLRDTHGCTFSLLPIEQPGVLPDGWDCKNAIETDGWTFEQVQAFLARAYVLTDAADAPAAKPAAEKKRDDPVGTESGDDEPEAEGWEHELVACGHRKVPRWLSHYYDADKGRWNVSRKTVIAALEKWHELRGVVAYDELRNTVVCRKAFPWPNSKPGEIRGADALLLGKYMSDTWGLPAISKAALEEGLQTVAHAERFHPVRDWLGRLAWDGTSRIDKWLIHVLGEAPETLRPALADYLRLVGRFWLLGMVYRVMEPGCKFDYMPVLEGVGGLRKSTLVEALASADYYSDTPFEVGRGKEGPEQVQGCWLYEIAELTHFSKAEVGAIKAFISSKVDRYRVAYGSTVEAFPRQCVLVGTTNEDTYLRDRTGNRRIWPVPVKQRIRTEWVEKWREQLFAEAYHLYLRGEGYTPTPEQEARLFQPMQESRLVETAVESELMVVLTRKPVPNTAGPLGFVHSAAPHVTVAQLVQALGVDVAKAPPGLQGQITAWLKHEGWLHAKKMIDGVRIWRYHRPEKWPREDVVLGLDQITDDEPGASAPAPDEPQAEAPPVPETPAGRYLADLGDDSAPF